MACFKYNIPLNPKNFAYNTMPNLCNADLERKKCLYPYSYNPQICWNPNMYCHDPSYSQTNDLVYNDPDPCLEKYDYHTYFDVPYQDPSVVLGFGRVNLVSNIFNTAINIDTNLSDPGESIVVDNVMWVVGTSSGLIIPYNLAGRPASWHDGHRKS